MKPQSLSFAIFIFLAGFGYGQDKNDSAIVAKPIKTKSNVNSHHYGIFASVSGSYNPSGQYFHEEGVHALGGYDSNAFSNIKKAMGIGFSAGVEYISKKSGRWFFIASLSVSYYSYYASADEYTIEYTGFGNQYFQKTDSALHNYTFIDYMIRNYLSLNKSKIGRLSAGIGLSGSICAYNNTDMSFPQYEDIPTACLFVSGSLRYDLAIASDETIAIEPFYNYEYRSVSQSYPRLASFGLRLSLLYQ